MLQSYRNSIGLIAAMPLFALVMPMLPGFLGAIWLQVYRPWFWAEFLLIALMTRGRSWLFAFGLAVLWGAEFLFSFAQINLSSNYLDVIELLNYLPYTNVGWLMAGVGGVVGLVLWGVLCLRIHRRASPGRGMLLWTLLILASALAWPGRDGFDHSESKLYTISDAKWAGSWLMDSKYMQRSLSFYEEGYEPEQGQFLDVGTDGSAIRHARALDAPSSKMLLVIVESWGVSHDQEENRLWGNLWNSPAWSQESGTLPFIGATVQGELRELCGLLPKSLRIDEVPHADKCLPQVLRANGWRTQSFHGASAKMYQRDQWYPMIGFDQSYFLPQLMGNGVKCANIPGICDYSIAQRVVQTLQQDGRQFTYWLTLNSHTPYRESDLSSPRVKDLVCPSLDLKGARCVHAALLYDFMQALKTALLKHPIPGLKVVLVGDHTPKFFDAQARNDFDETVVPYIVLRTPQKHLVAEN